MKVTATSLKMMHQIEVDDLLGNCIHTLGLICVTPLGEQHLKVVKFGGFHCKIHARQSLLSWMSETHPIQHHMHPWGHLSINLLCRAVGQ